MHPSRTELSRKFDMLFAQKLPQGMSSSGHDNRTLAETLGSAVGAVSDPKPTIHYQLVRSLGT